MYTFAHSLTMNQSPTVTERRAVRRGPAFARSRDYQRHVEQQARFLVVRASDAVPGSKTWREKRARSGERPPFRTELEMIRSVLERGADSGNHEIFEEAVEAVWDLTAGFTRLVGRLITDGRQRLARWDREEVA